MNRNRAYLSPRSASSATKCPPTGRSYLQTTFRFSSSSRHGHREAPLAGFVRTTFDSARRGFSTVRCAEEQTMRSIPHTPRWLRRTIRVAIATATLAALAATLPHDVTARGDGGKNARFPDLIAVPNHSARRASPSAAGRPSSSGTCSAGPSTAAICERDEAKCSWRRVPQERWRSG